ncbi:hypothetical protein CTAYLR_003359 [Chrysophaeum taylorii]|uniref:Uncharacterized protein n=1 Tax=Chrysophaeum taylorii TaxID=2483200 RepID=A0AAD7UET0_9STRA|nr:hypothetical protein CTAYLR_003359 [Chrysophaeum taylorii]
MHWSGFVLVSLVPWCVHRGGETTEDDEVVGTPVAENATVGNASVAENATAPPLARIPIPPGARMPLPPRRTFSTTRPPTSKTFASLKTKRFGSTLDKTPPPLVSRRPAPVAFAKRPIPKSDGTNFTALNASEPVETSIQEIVQPLVTPEDVQPPLMTPEDAAGRATAAAVASVDVSSEPEEVALLSPRSRNQLVRAFSASLVSFAIASANRASPFASAAWIGSTIGATLRTLLIVYQVLLHAFYAYAPAIWPHRAIRP